MSSPASSHAEAGELAGQVLDALSVVYDPELDEPITTLRFVSSCSVTEAGDVEVLLRLPTPQCAPNFAFLMAADARRAVTRVPGVRAVSITLEDHYTGDEINSALADGKGFTGAFPGETDDDDLESLRELFERKALTARQARICAQLLAEGMTPDEVVDLRVRDLPETSDARRCLQLRAKLDLRCDEEAAGLVLANGQPVPLDQFERWRRMGRLIATSLEANGGICRSLLEFRHDLTALPARESTSTPAWAGPQPEEREVAR